MQNLIDFGKFRSIEDWDSLRAEIIQAIELLEKQQALQVADGGKMAECGDCGHLNNKGFLETFYCHKCGRKNKIKN